MIKRDFQKCKKITSFRRKICTNIVSLKEVLREQTRLKDKIDKFNESLKPQIKEKKKE